MVLVKGNDYAHAYDKMPLTWAFLRTVFSKIETGNATMCSLCQSATHYFNSYESREAAFCKHVYNLIPCKTEGPGRFWRDFSRISRRIGQVVMGPETAYITSNPRDCLAFSSPEQVLWAALMITDQRYSNPTAQVSAMARLFGIENTLKQPLRTLSGGETIKLALAKIHIQMQRCRKVVIASPFCWLSSANAIHLHRVVVGCRQKGLEVTLLSLLGEDSRSTLAAPLAALIDSRTPSLHLRCRGVTIPLGSAVDVTAHLPGHARLNDIDTELASPCLLVGDNGQGKSLVAKALCGAMPIGGQIEIHTNGREGRARLLFQDVLTQTLLRSNPTIARSHGTSEDSWCLYRAISRRISHIGREMGLSFNGDHHIAGQQLLKVKIMIVAVRLCTLPTVLVLDEPDWGLTRPVAIALVLAVIQEAHAMGVALILISHKPWWDPIARSMVIVRKRPADTANSSNLRFYIETQVRWGRGHVLET